MPTAKISNKPTIIKELINMKRVHEKAILPTQGSEFAAGMDLYTCEDVTLGPNEYAMVGTGWQMEIPTGWFGAMYPRSGMSTKQGIVLRNTVGIIDSDYRGEVKIPLWNISDKEVKIEAGTRVAQLIIQPFFLGGVPTEVTNLSDTERGEGGFGSTGTK